MSTPKTPTASKRLQSAKSSAVGSGSGTASVSNSSLLDVFPVWNEQQQVEKEDKNAGRFEDPLGLSLPAAAEPFCDAWKRAEELLQGSPAVPMVCVKPLAAGEAPTAADLKKGKEVLTSRELDGKLYAGHEMFEWLLAIFSYVMAAEKSLKKGEYLWELISPKEKDGLPARSATGKYRVKLFLLDTWRTVTVDDRIPLDLFGRPLLVGSRPLQLWPLLLCKAILKVMAVYRSMDKTQPHQVAAFQMLTGWPQEDLLDALGGTPLAGGALFDRLEDVLPGPMKQVQGLPAIVSCCLVRRSKPQRAPPRLLVLSGASAVGRSQLVARLLAEFPDKFGATVSHTSRPPKEHEVDGKDYHFTTKQQLLADARAKRVLEAARVDVHRRPSTSSAAAAAAAPPQALSYWYGTSLSTVREVAATGKLCVMSLDVQGAEALRSNPRIDGLYLYISSSCPEVLAQRQKQRLSEAGSTLGKRLAWAKQQVAKSSSAGLFDNVITNTSMAEVYMALKEAISKLSPIIRNRLRGLPAYVLDYSDLIPPNSVEKPFLKPVILAGPHTGERRRLLEMLVDEFPDVFAFPRQHTTRPADLHSRHVGADGDELQLVTEQAVAAGSEGAAQASAGEQASKHESGPADGAAAGSDTTCSPPGSMPSSAAPGGGSDYSNSSNRDILGPPPHVLSKEDFEAAVTSGQLLEDHADLFTHPLATYRYGHSMEDIQDIIKAGKLPLLELDVEQTELVKITKAVDCLSVFLAPPSLEEHQQRLQLSVTETDQEIADRAAVAAADLAAVQARGVFDQVLVNDELEAGYRQLKVAISRFRPDLIPPATDDAATKVAQQVAANTFVPVVFAGPTGGGREQLVQQLLQRFPQRFAVPRPVTDRKPGKGEKEAASADVDFVKPDVLAKLAAQGQVVWSVQDAAAGGTTAFTTDAVSSILVAGRMAVLDVGAATAEQLQAVKQHPALKQAFVVYVSRPAALKASLAAAGTPEASVAALLTNQAAAESAIAAMQGVVQAFVTNDEQEEAFTQLQVPISAAYPWAMPPLLQPLVVAGPFGSGKRAVLQQLVALLPNVLAVPKVVTSKPHMPGKDEGMQVVPAEVAQQMLSEGQFLVHQEVLGHIYGITSGAVRKLQALGKLPLLDLDRVQDVEELRASGFQATFVYLQPQSLDALQAHIKAEILASPPLHYEPEEAAAKAAAEAAREGQAAAARPDRFDAVVPLDDAQDTRTVLGRLGLELHQRYPSAVPSSFVWGFGRPLWDPSVRMLGLKPLKVMVLGPAASGKSMQSAMLAERFGVPHVNVGDLLYAQVAAKTALGQEAQRHMDSSKTVPDTLLMRLLLDRLQQPDCHAVGWVLDGFPHTRKQAEQLAAAGHVPDKVILLEGPHALLLNRVKYRRIDYTTGKVYHMAEAGALSEPVRPVKPDGTPDAEVIARLSVRHDDSPQNVANRLALWDRQVQGLRAAYEDVIHRLPAAGVPAATFAQAEAFVELEAVLPSGSDAVAPGSVGPLVESWQLEELSYRVVAEVRYKRKQLVQLQQLDGKLFYCDLKELAGNCSCMLLAHNPGGLPIAKSSKRLDTTCIQHQQLLLVDSLEPLKLVACLSMGPQHLAMPPPAQAKKVFVLAGPQGAGRSSLAQLLLKDFSGKVVATPLLTNRAPHPLEVATNPGLLKQWRPQPAKHTEKLLTVPAPCGRTSQPPTTAVLPSALDGQWPGSKLLQFVPEQQFKVLQQSHQLVGLHQHVGHSYAVPAAAIEAAAHQGKAALVVGSVHLAEQLMAELCDAQVVCVYLDADTGSLSQRLRQLAELDEEAMQSLLADAAQQKHKLQALQEQQVQRLGDQLQPHQHTSTSVPQTPAAGRGGSPGKPLVQLPQVTLPSTPSTARAGQQLQQQHPWQSQPQQAHGCDSLLVGKQSGLFCVPNTHHQLQVCYTRIKGLLAKCWPTQQQFQPGLLLLQHHPASKALAAAASEAPASAKQPGGSAGSAASSSSMTPGVQAAAAQASKHDAGAVPVLVPGLDHDTFHSSSTVLRLRALTAASTQLVVPRGRHLLQLQCCPGQLHCVTLHASGDFTLDTGDKLLPTACKMHVVRESGDTASLPAGSRQLLFRYLIKPSEVSQVSIQYQTTSPALQACTRLLLLEVATGKAVPDVQQPTLQLQPSDKGYLLLALVELPTDVPASSWSVVLTSSQRLPHLTEVPYSRHVVFGGTYAANTKAVMARFVITPAAAVNVAVLAQLRLTSAAPHTLCESNSQASPAVPRLCIAPGSNGVDASNSSSPDSLRSDSTEVPLRFAVQVYDTAGAKEVGWHATYQLLATAHCHSNGRIIIPNLHLAPGKYLLVLVLQQQGSRQWVDPVTGSTSPSPEWQVQLLPGADDKVCPIVQDDSWQRHCEFTKEAWQQQGLAAAAAAAAAAGPAGAGRPGSSSAKAAMAAAKDRAKFAQAALERHLAAATAEQNVGPGNSNSSIAAAPSSARGTTGAAGTSSQQQQPPASAEQTPAAAASTAGGRKLSTAAVKAKPAAAQHAASANAQSGVQVGAGALAGVTPSSNADVLMASCATDSSSHHAGAGQQQQQLWPGAVPAAPKQHKQPSEVFIRAVKGAAADALQLSPADQLNLVVPAKPPLSLPISTSSTLASNGTTIQQPVAGRKTDSGAAGNVKVLTAGEYSFRLEQLQASVAHKAEVLVQAANRRAELQAAVPKADQQVSNFLSWRDQALAQYQAALLHKHDVVQSLFPALPPAQPPLVAATPAAAAHKTTDKTSAAKGARA